MKRILLVVAALAILAASPGEVVSELEDQGFYIESGSNASSEVVGDAVADAGFSGGRLYVVVLSEEPASGATFFAGSVLDELGSGTVLTVAPESIGYDSDGNSWSADELDDAYKASRNETEDDDVVVRFVESLPAVGGGGSDSGDQEGSGGGFIWLLVFIGGLTALFFYLRSRSQKTSATARARRLEQFRTAAQGKLNEVANDILEMETEVTMSENTEVQQHYKSASAKYAEVVDKVGTVTDPEELLDLSYQLDIAIWELDVAEAHLDGKTPPKKPEPPKLEKPEPSASRKSGPVITTPTPTPPAYDRRPQRQSSPAGPDLGNILLALLAARGMGGGGNYSGRWTGGGRGSSGGGSRGGGPRMGGGGGGRIRGGGRRGG